MKGLVEYAKSGRASCRGCSAKIEKGLPRLGLLDKAADRFSSTRWFHPECYFKAADDKSPAPAPSALDGYSSLKNQDKELLARLEQSKKAGSGGGKGGAGEEEQAMEDVKASPGRQVLAAIDAKQQQGQEVEVRIKGLLASFDPDKALDKYKEVKLPSPWRAFQTVIFHPGSGAEPNPRIAAFDFDGCLANTDVRKMGAEEWSLQFPSVPQRLKRCHAEGFKLAIFTNESNIDRFTKARKKAVDSKIGRLNALLDMLEVPVQVFIACGTSYSYDAFRKPAPGMWRLLEHMNGGVPLDLELSFFVGDAAGREQDHSSADIDFARNVGVSFKVPEDFFLPSP